MKHRAFLKIEPLEQRFMLSVAPGIDRPLPQDTEHLVPFADVAGQLSEDPGHVAARAGLGPIGFDGSTSEFFSNPDAAGPTGDATPTGSNYMLIDNWGGSWSDAEKEPPDDYDGSAPGTGDDYLCWAAAASNILDWSGWGHIGGNSDADDVFQYFEDHWTDRGGLTGFGWQWWFDGTNPTLGWDGWSQVDVPGGGFYQDVDLTDYYLTFDSNTSQVMSTVDTYLHDGYGVALGIYGPGGHMITCWGYNYNPSNPSDYNGVWVTDSDDAKHLTDAPDQLRYYEVENVGGRWYLQDYYGSDAWYIDVVQGLAQSPSPSSSGQIVDNGDAGFTTTDGWYQYAGEGYQNDIHYSFSGDGSDVATWTFDVTPGQYQVSASWLQGRNRATDSPFAVLDGYSTLQTVRLNQELAPNDFTDAGVGWENLGTFNVSGNTLRVRLSDNANDFVIADAIRVERVGDPVQDPEIQVTLDGANIADGSGSVDFGATTVGTALTETFTVTNTGSGTLSLGGAISLPSGFTLVSGFGDTTLTAGQSTTFAARLAATAAGTFSGQVSFANNDDDESPFNFSVSGTVAAAPAPPPTPTTAEIIDNGDAGFTTSGGWYQYSGEGHQNDIHYSFSGDGSDVATWTFDVTPGRYRVSASWLQGRNRATDSPFAVLDGYSTLQTVRLNQELAPNDFTDAGAGWEDLGTFDVTGNTLRVRLSDNADDFVIADAIRVERVGDLVQDPEIIDNGDAGFTTTGGWYQYSGEGHQNDIHYSFSGDGSDVATWTFDVTPGRYQVSASWLQGRNRATDSPFTVLDGYSALQTVRLNQELAPNDFTDAGAAWENLGTFDISGNTLRVRLSDGADDFVIADAIRVERVGDVAQDPEIQVSIDGTNIADGSGSVNFGATTVGTALTETFTVTNTGSGTLSLGGAISLPSGFTLVSGLGDTTLAAGQATTFAVRLDASTAGTFSGQISFTNNDADEGPFNFAISGTVTAAPAPTAPQIIDNGEAGFDFIGDWWVYEGGGFNNNVYYTPWGFGLDGAFWSFDVTPGQYRVSATWLYGSSQASDAPFTVFDGAATWETVLVDQTLAPNDFVDEGSAWETLGTFEIATDTLTVMLTDDANGYVIADAIRIERVGGTAAGQTSSAAPTSSCNRADVDRLRVVDMAFELEEHWREQCRR